MTGIQTHSRRATDAFGITLSAVCGVHCLLTPLLLPAMPALGSVFASPWAHWILAGLIVPLGGIAYWRGYRKSRRVRAILIGTVGMTCILLGATIVPDACCASEPSLGSLAINIGGSLSLIVAHVLNILDAGACTGVCHE